MQMSLCSAMPRPGAADAGGLELLVEDHVVAEVGDAAAAELLGDVDAEKAVGARALEDLAGHDAGLFPLVGVRDHLLVDPAGRRWRGTGRVRPRRCRVASNEGTGGGGAIMHRWLAPFAPGSRPSPTGYFHVGGGRSVLYNWFLARQSPDGVLILRIEDTDRERHGEEHVEGIRRAIRWLGLDWDEEYRQSERTASVRGGRRAAARAAATRTSATARARRSTPARSEGDPQGGYDRFCRDRGSAAPTGNALRFRCRTGKTVIDDKVRGEVEFDNDNIQDFVIQRADGSALFILANVVDDIDMRVTHVVRGEEHLSNTAPYELLWVALGGGELPGVRAPVGHREREAAEAVEAPRRRPRGAGGVRRRGLPARRDGELPRAARVVAER